MGLEEACCFCLHQVYCLSDEIESMNFKAYSVAIFASFWHTALTAPKAHRLHRFRCRSERVLRCAGKRRALGSPVLQCTIVLFADMCGY